MQKKQKTKKRTRATCEAKTRVHEVLFGNTSQTIYELVEHGTCMVQLTMNLALGKPHLFIKWQV